MVMLSYDNPLQRGSYAVPLDCLEIIGRYAAEPLIQAGLTQPTWEGDSTMATSEAIAHDEDHDVTISCE